MPNILQELQDIFRDVLDQPDLVLTRDSNANNVEDWDSLSHVSLVTTIEKHYKMAFREQRNRKLA
jgi:acyl carrier protein